MDWLVALIGIFRREPFFITYIYHIKPTVIHVLSLTLDGDQALDG